MKLTSPKITHTILLILFLFSYGCVEEERQEKAKATKPAPAKERSLPDGFKSYWFAGEAELTSYSLEQARYGELRDGHAVLIFVTEPFLPGKQVKADDSHPDNIQVLKLNSTRKYLTGIYPYSVMTSTFYPVLTEGHAIKVTGSVQEWCGHVYSQLNNRDKYEVQSHSYFEEEGDREFSLEKSVLEDEVWTQLRIDPSKLPTGAISIIPSMEYLRLAHKDFKAYEAEVKLEENGDINTYEIFYTELDRVLQIHFNPEFPYTIEGWTDTYKSGFGNNAKKLTTTATKRKILKTPYWQKNGNKDVILRDSLGL